VQTCFPAHLYSGAVPVVLVVEDDFHVRSALVRELSRYQYVVRSAGTALAALREVAADPPDIVVLDLGLPDLDGAQVLRMLRGEHDIPVIIASGRQDDAEVVRLLRAGADDYLVKPFSADQLEARVSAVLRRTGKAAAIRDAGTPTLTVGELVVDSACRTVVLEGTEIRLTRREFDLLAYLAARPDRVVSRRELLNEVWRQAFGQDQTIDVHVSLLRRKLGESAASPRYLHTVRGVGVRLSAPPSDSASAL
jgi:DNA-binding response OmpR family regulator